MRKFDIRQKLRLFVIAGSILGFILFGMLSVFALLNLWAELNKYGGSLGNSLTAQIENFTRREETDRLIESTQLRAELIDYEARAIQEDVQNLSLKLSSLSQNLQLHKTVELPNALNEEILAGTPYVHFSPELVERGAPPEIIYEMQILSNIAEDEKFLIQHYANYPCIFVGSKNGYTIRIEQPEYEEQIATMCLAAWRHSYDARQRTWYKLGVEKNSIAFTDVYKATLGYPCFSCVAPYYDNSGFAGVVGIDINLEDMHIILKDNAFNENEISFIIGNNGEILSSTQQTGILKVSGIDNDLRQLQNLNSRRLLKE